MQYRPNFLNVINLRIYEIDLKNTRLLYDTHGHHRQPPPSTPRQKGSIHWRFKHADSIAYQKHFEQIWGKSAKKCSNLEFLNANSTFKLLLLIFF